MILAVGMLASIVVAWLRGGRLSALTSISIRWGALAVAGFVIQTYFIYQHSVLKVPGQWGWQEILFVGSYALLLMVVWANRAIPGIKFIGLGLLMNALVIIANGGWMPVTPEAIVKVGYTHLVPSLTSGMRVYASKDILLLAQETRLRILSDVFVLSRPFPVPSVFSGGDVAVALGAFWFLQKGMQRPGTTT